MHPEKRIKNFQIAVVWALCLFSLGNAPALAQEKATTQVQEPAASGNTDTPPAQPSPNASTPTVAPNPELTVPDKKTTPSHSSSLIKTILALLFVLGMLFAIVWIMKRSGFSPANKRNGFYKLIAINSIGQREKIALVEIGNTWLVLGMTAHSINTLHTLPKGSLDLGKGNNTAASFAKMLERLKTPQGKIP